MVDVNCSKLEIVNAFPQLSLREIEEAIAWAQH